MPDKPNAMADLVNAFVAELGKDHTSEIIRAERISEVAAIIDTLRLRPDIGSVSVGMHIATKLANWGYLGVEEQYGVQDYDDEITVHPYAEAKAMADTFCDITLLRRYTTEWREPS